MWTHKPCLTVDIKPDSVYCKCNCTGSFAILPWTANEVVKIMFYSSFLCLLDLLVFCNGGLILLEIRMSFKCAQAYSFSYVSFPL